MQGVLLMPFQIYDSCEMHTQRIDQPLLHWFHRYPQALKQITYSEFISFACIYCSLFTVLSFLFIIIQSNSCCFILVSNIYYGTYTQLNVYSTHELCNCLLRREALIAEDVYGFIIHQCHPANIRTTAGHRRPLIVRRLRLQFPREFSANWDLNTVY